MEENKSILNPCKQCLVYVLCRTKLIQELERKKSNINSMLFNMFEEDKRFHYCIVTISMLSELYKKCKLIETYHTKVNDHIELNADKKQQHNAKTIISQDINRINLFLVTFKLYDLLGGKETILRYFNKWHKVSDDMTSFKESTPSLMDLYTYTRTSNSKDYLK